MQRWDRGVTRCTTHCRPPPYCDATIGDRDEIWRLLNLISLGRFDEQHLRRRRVAAGATTELREAGHLLVEQPRVPSPWNRRGNPTFRHDVGLAENRFAC